MTTSDEADHQRVMRETLKLLANIDMSQSPPAMAKRIHALVREMTGRDDPYLSAKEQFNRLALDIYPELERRVAESPEPLATTIRLLIAGNIIDLGIHHELDETQVHEAIEHALLAPFDADLEGFAEDVATSQRILFLADNAGEIVFDRLLIDRLPREKLTVAVKGSPILNDALMADAETAGLVGRVEVIDNGDNAPGTILEACSEDFRRLFETADLVIAKGQGNYETLSEVDKDIFFILKAKCPVIAEHLGCPVGSLVLKRSAKAV
jgi:hypothetical protein